jgi:hypothetical protein
MLQAVSKSSCNESKRPFVASAADARCLACQGLWNFWLFRRGRCVADPFDESEGTVEIFKTLAKPIGGASRRRT